jgi:hypothetical protein
MFWHRQAAASFDAQGQLTEPLRVNWGGDHDRVAELLAGLPEPFSVKDIGPRVTPASRFLRGHARVVDGTELEVSHVLPGSG